MDLTAITPTSPLLTDHSANSLNREPKVKVVGPARNESLSESALEKLQEIGSDSFSKVSFNPVKANNKPYIEAKGEIYKKNVKNLRDDTHAIKDWIEKLLPHVAELTKISEAQLKEIKELIRLVQVEDDKRIGHNKMSIKIKSSFEGYDQKVAEICKHYTAKIYDLSKEHCDAVRELLKPSIDIRDSLYSLRVKVESESDKPNNAETSYKIRTTNASNLASPLIRETRHNPDRLADLNDWVGTNIQPVEEIASLKEKQEVNNRRIDKLKRHIDAAQTNIKDQKEQVQKTANAAKVLFGFSSKELIDLENEYHSLMINLLHKRESILEGLYKDLIAEMEDLWTEFEDDTLSQVIRVLKENIDDDSFIPNIFQRIRPKKKLKV